MAHVLRGHERLPHDAECTVEVAFDQVGIDTHDTQPARDECLVTNPVDVPAVEVDRAVDFHDEPARRSAKVYDETELGALIREGVADGAVG